MAQLQEMFETQRVNIVGSLTVGFPQFRRVNSGYMLYLKMCFLILYRKHPCMTLDYLMSMLSAS